ncbi:MAG TPA: TM2 domain-containing protein [Fimbriimonadaceae bacterium]|nr:TM2 domain-containing protein [Fimbriimonadaceae bacterium]
MGDPNAYKLCPVCKTAAYLDAQVCSGCGHRYSTQFAPPPNQTQAFYGPQANPNLDPYQLNNPYGRPDSQKLLITILLWFFLGHFGAHRFYLGHINTAVMMLGLEILGIVTACILIGYLFLFAVFVWWVIDLVQMLTGNLRPTDGSRII